MTQKKVIHRLFWVWNFEKEERWLNTMAQSGWVLPSIRFGKLPSAISAEIHL